MRTLRDVANASHPKLGFPVPTGVHVDARFADASWPRSVPLPDSVAGRRGQFVYRVADVSTLPFVLGWGTDSPSADGVLFANQSFVEEWRSISGARVVQAYDLSALERSYVLVPWYDRVALRAAFDAGFRSVVEHPMQQSLVCSCLDEGDARLGTQAELDCGYRFRADPRDALQALELCFSSDEELAACAAWLPADIRTFAH